MKLFGKTVKNNKINYYFLGIKYRKEVINSSIDEKDIGLTKIVKPYCTCNVKIGRGTYIASNSVISDTCIGKFCSIGPNFMCGYGIHPTNGISTAPCFYSTRKQNGITFSKIDKIKERLPINIGNDVFIGMNVSVLDGVSIGDGAVIGAGAVITRDIPPFAIAVGVPAKVIKYRFSKEIIDKLLKIKWWDWDNDKLKNVEEMFFDVENFVNKYGD
jgi:acetyltransferase-like isoleucine patch superfamily enzyme